jgi:dTDP-glucose 4,6-dehydratase
MAERILVTGGAGFIGSNFVHHLVRHHPEHPVHVFDKLTYAGNRKNLPEVFFTGADGRYRFSQGCMTHREQVTDAVVDADVVVHFACESHVSNSLAQADEFVMTNVYGSMVLCEEIVKYPVRLFILISSSEVYGTALTKPMDEEHPLRPASPYAGSKAGQDRLACTYHCSFGIPVVILRPFNQYGPRQHVEKVIPRFITTLLQGKKIQIENEGVQTRDWLYVEDLCSAITRVIQSKRTDLFGQVINIGSGRETSIHEIATRIARLLNVKPADAFMPGNARKGQVMSHISSTQKAGELLGWKAATDLDDGLRKTVEWYRQNESWWRSLKSPVLRIAEMGH